jgi:hypothetical protein
LFGKIFKGTLNFKESNGPSTFAFHFDADHDEPQFDFTAKSTFKRNGLSPPQLLPIKNGKFNAKTRTFYGYRVWKEGKANF